MRPPTLPHAAGPGGVAPQNPMQARGPAYPPPVAPQHVVPAPVAPHEPEPEKKKPSALVEFVRNSAKLILLAVVVLVGCGAYLVWERRQPYEWSGSVEIKTVAVGSRVGGRVAEIRVHEGQQVEKGDVLVVLDASELEAHREIAQADLEGAEAGLDKLIKGARPEEIAQANARVSEARAGLSRTGTVSAQQAREAQAAAALYKSGAISAAEYQAKLANARAAGGGTGEKAAAVKEAEASLSLLQGGARSEDVRVARAHVAVARAKLALVQNNIAEMSIRAPKRARVERVLVRPGDLLKADKPATTLLEAGELYVRIFVPETLLGKVHVGEELAISVDSFPGRRFKGRVDHISEQGEFTPRRLVTTEDRASEVFSARIALLEGERDLRAGMAAFVHIAK